MTHPPLRDSSRPRTTRLNQAMDVAITLGVAVLILVGFASSYRTLRDLAVAVGGYPPWLAPAVPLSFDLGIVVLSLKITRAAREGRTAVTLRLLVGALSTSTVVVNATAANGTAGRFLHAVPPAMFVICFETVIVTARRRALEAAGLYPDPLPRQHLVRWVLAPRTTWSSWRAAVLQQPVVSTPDPVARDRDVAGSPAAGPGSQREQLRVVTDMLSRHPNARSSALRQTLAEQGHPVSLRTAQRLRAAVLSTRTIST